MAQLHDSLIKCQSDIISLKQEKHILKQCLDDGVKSIKNDVITFKQEISKEIKNMALDIQRIEDEKLNGIAGLRNSLKLSNADVKEIKECTESDIKTLWDKIAGVAKRIDRQNSKIESKISEINNMAQSAPARNNASIGPSDYSKPKDDTMNNKCNSHCDKVSYRNVLVNNSTVMHPLPGQSCQHVDSTVNSNLVLIEGSTNQTNHTVRTANISTHEIQDDREQSPLDPRLTGDASGCKSTTGKSSSSPSNIQRIPVCISSNRVQKTVDLDLQSDEHFTSHHKSVIDDAGSISAYTDEDGFSEHVIKKTKRFYVGGFKSSITIPKLTSYVTNRGPKK